MTQTKIGKDVLDNLVSTDKITDGSVTTSNLNPSVFTDITGPQLSDTLDLSSNTLTFSTPQLTPQIRTAGQDENAFNIGLLGFKQAVSEGLTIFNLVDGVVDEFHDEGGVDTPENSNAAYDSSSDFYSNQSGPNPVPASTENTSYTSGTGDYTADSDTTAINVLVIAGGGGGATNQNSAGGGGGAGGRVFTPNLPVTGGGTYEYVVGAGGAAGAAPMVNVGVVGSNSTFAGTTTAVGGGYGAAGTGVAAGNGGSGGGGGARGTAGEGTAGQGNDGGGSGPGDDGKSGGGGGSGAVGAISPQNNYGGAGGAGTADTIADGSTSVTRAGGGGGGGASGPGGAGGSGGGGAGGTTTSSNATAGTVNTGGGGGGSGGNGSASGTAGAGGSGIVVVQKLTSLTINTSMTLISDTFTASATPSKARIVVFAELPDGTGDFTVSVTRDNSTYNAATLTDEGFQAGSSGIKIFSGSTPLTGTGSPQVALRWKIVGSSLTGNNKIHGVSLQWA